MSGDRSIALPIRLSVQGDYAGCYLRDGIIMLGIFVGKVPENVLLSSSA